MASPTTSNSDRYPRVTISASPPRCHEKFDRGRWKARDCRVPGMKEQYERQGLLGVSQTEDRLSNRTRRFPSLPSPTHPPSPAASAHGTRPSHTHATDPRDQQQQAAASFPSCGDPSCRWIILLLFVLSEAESLPGLSARHRLSRPLLLLHPPRGRRSLGVNRFTNEDTVTEERTSLVWLATGPTSNELDRVVRSLARRKRKKKLSGRMDLVDPDRVPRGTNTEKPAGHSFMVDGKPGCFESTRFKHISLCADFGFLSWRGVLMFRGSALERIVCSMQERDGVSFSRALIVEE